MRKLLDYKKLIKRIWIILWLILLILVIAKVCFKVWYPVVIENKKLNSLFTIIERTLWVKTIIMLACYIVSMLIWYLTATKQKKLTKKRLLIVITILIMLSFVKSRNNTLGSIVELLYLNVIPVVLNLKRETFENKIKNILIPPMIYIMINCWQFTIYLVRDIPYSPLSSEHFGSTFILMLDYYIFIIIQWLGVSFMGLWSGGWLFGKSITELKAMRDEELSREEPNQELLKDIDKAIAKYEESKKEIID